MDAKPQKPMRGFHVHGDENAVPNLPGNKSLHSRNKSSPALSTMAAAGANKFGTKRTAFGDLSNTVQGARAVKDDSTLTAKFGNAKENLMVAQPDKKAPAALSRPAQRPLSISTGIKGLLSNVTSSTTAAKAAPEPKQIPAQNTRKVLTKRSTAIFKDSGVSAPPLEGANDSQKPQISTQRVLNSHPQLPPTSSEGTSQPPRQRAQSVHSTVATHRGGALVASETTHSTSGAQPAAESKEEPARAENEANIRDVSAAEPTDAYFPLITANIEAATKPAREKVTVPETSAMVGSTAENVQLAPSKARLLTVSEQEEYWDLEDEEDDEELYDEEGYVTARSFKSRGENVTGNATQTLVPRVNVKIKREIAAAKEFVESMRTQEDIEDDEWDTTMVAEYGEEIFEYMRDLEVKMQPNAHYMDFQTEIQWSMRSVLMDWLVQVHHRFQLLPETLFLCVNYIDRFLSCKVVSLGKLQLVGATAIFIAAKYEEINCPSVNEIVFMVDGGYTVEEILKAERFMLSMLQFELGWPGPMSFLRRISKADDYDLETRTLAKYLLELTIMDERFLGCPPSFTAAGAHCLARMLLKKGNWSPAHVYYSNYTYSQLYSLVQLIIECCENPAKHHAAIFEKYQDKRYKGASPFVKNELRKGFQIPDVATNNAQTLLNFYGPTSSWPSQR